MGWKSGIWVYRQQLMNWCRFRRLLYPKSFCLICKFFCIWLWILLRKVTRRPIIGPLVHTSTVRAGLGPWELCTIFSGWAATNCNCCVMVCGGRPISTEGWWAWVLYSQVWRRTRGWHRGLTRCGCGCAASAQPPKMCLAMLPKVTHFALWEPTSVHSIPSADDVDISAQSLRWALDSVSATLLRYSSLPTRSAKNLLELRTSSRTPLMSASPNSSINGLEGD